MSLFLVSCASSKYKENQCFSTPDKQYLLMIGNKTSSGKYNVTTVCRSFACMGVPMFYELDLKTLDKEMDGRFDEIACSELE